MDKKKRGRPQRSPLEAQRIKLWVKGVCVAAGRAPNELSDVLGEDGVWNGMWSRYSRGIVAPMQQRLERIDTAFPGSARYYSSPLWMLVVEREFSWSELRVMAEWLRKLFRDAILGDARKSCVHGKFWAIPSNSYEILMKAGMLIEDQKFGLDALTVILFILRQAELQQDGELYLHAMKTLATAEMRKEAHPVLSALPQRFFAKLIEPLRNIRFADPRVDNFWILSFEEYCRVNEVTHSSCDIFDVIRTYLGVAFDWEDDSDED